MVAVTGRPGIGAIVAAVLLPPLGVFLARGFGPGFWLDLVLTIFGWVPGIILALVLLFRPGLLARV